MFVEVGRGQRAVAPPVQAFFDVVFEIGLGICRHGLHLAPDIYLAGHDFGDEGLAVLFEEFDGTLFVGAEFVDLFGFSVEEIRNLDLLVLGGKTNFEIIQCIDS